MSKLKITILLAVVSLIAVPVTLARAQQPTLISVGAVGTAIIFDDMALSDAITYALTDVTQPAAGRELVGWLVSDDGEIKLSTGPMVVGADGSVAHTFDNTTKRYTGENLIHAYDKVVVTDEAAGSDPNAPAGPAVYSHEIPAGGIVHIRHLLTNWPLGDPKGILTHLNEQLDAAILHANLADRSTTLAQVHQHMEHVINIIEGEGGPNFGDLDGDGSTQNPGDGIGVLAHAADRKHGPFASGAAPDDVVIVAHAALVDQYGANAEQAAGDARDQALLVLDQTDVKIARLFLAGVMGAVNSAKNGFADKPGAEQAYREAQLMATYSLEPGPPPAPPTPTPEPTATPAPATPTPEPTATPEPAGPSGPSIGLPVVGDSSVPAAARLALIASLLFLIAGGVFVFRGRRSETKA